MILTQQPNNGICTAKVNLLNYNLVLIKVAYTMFFYNR